MKEMRFVLDVLEKDGEKMIELPEEVLLALGWKEGTVLEWLNNGDGSWTLKEKKMDFVEKIVEFNRIAGTGGEFDPRKVGLYIGLQLEELEEKIESIPDTTGQLKALRETLDGFSKQFKKGDFDELVKDIDRVGALDADVDLAVVSLGGAASLGADVNGACHEVMDSNLSKYPVGADGIRYALKDINGKVMKPAGWKPPELAQYL